MADLSNTFYHRPKLSIDRTRNITPRRIPATAQCPHRPQAPELLVAAKVPLHKEYRPQTPLLKTVLCRKVRHSLADGFRDLAARAANEPVDVETYGVKTIEAVRAELG